MKTQIKINSVTIKWKSGFGFPQLEVFRKIKSWESAKKIIEKRNKENMLSAKWGSINLL